MTLLMLGLSHKTAPVEQREKASLTQGEARLLLRDLLAGGQRHRGRRAVHLQPHRDLRGRPGPGRSPRTR